MNWKTWLYSLVAASIGGASSAALSAFAMPDVFNLSHLGLVHLGKATLIGGLLPVLTLLKQSPLPTSSVTVTTTQTVEKTGDTVVKETV
jgi:hypothetical protein